jgi:esterase/lipase
VRKSLIGAATAAALAIAVWVSTPAPVAAVDTIDPDLRDGPDALVDRNNRVVNSVVGIVPGTEARIVWREPGQRTEYAVVYLHGFSASRQEIAPVPERVAERLGANLFEARLDGHGLLSESLHNVTAEGWIFDGNAALAIGAALGEKIILISTSTGGTLSLALLDHPNMAKVDTLVMLSPNIEPTNPNAKWLTRPGGALLAWIVTGGARSWDAYNELQERYWTTTIPITANIEVMRLVDHANQKWPASIDQNLLVFVSPHDQVVKPAAGRTAFAALDAPRKQLIEISEVSEASNHVIVGDILWPENNERFINEIVSFVRDSKSLPRISSAPE